VHRAVIVMTQFPPKARARPSRRRVGVPIGSRGARAFAQHNRTKFPGAVGIPPTHTDLDKIYSPPSSEMVFYSGMFEAAEARVPRQAYEVMPVDYAHVKTAREEWATVQAGRSRRHRLKAPR
jgi:hypothetical protein